jgi:para-aminobenzoate synthetase component 1
MNPVASEWMPIVEELSSAPDPEQVFLRLAAWEHCLFLDSARRDPKLGRYSFITADPFDYLQLGPDEGDGLARLAERLRGSHAPTIPGLPPFQGGAAGLVSYDLGQQLERLPRPRIDEFDVPALAIGLYDVVVAFDHVANRAWIISQGLPEQKPGRRRQRAIERMEQFRRAINSPTVPQRRTSAGERVVPASELAPQFSVGGPDGLTSNFSKPAYLQAIQRAIDYVVAGDIFQVNLAQRLLYPAHGDALELYLRLRRRNPATFAAWFDLGEFQIASASPERFLRVIDRQVEARPIKGTRPRSSLPEADLFAGDELQESIKDRAENIMIVDLLRNDLSRVCHADSVQVTELCRLEQYEYVQHLVSVVRGRLREPLEAIDLLRASFPGGSITGAPKVRAMEIIAELEPTARGAYCGSLIYRGFDGSFDSSILIRTITAGRGWWQAPVGGGIVAQSVPEREYAETWHKAEGLLRALR